MIASAALQKAPPFLYYCLLLRANAIDTCAATTTQAGQKASFLLQKLICVEKSTNDGDSLSWKRSL
jgi:hypothetical protein